VKAANLYCNPKLMAMATNLYYHYADPKPFS